MKRSLTLMTLMISAAVALSACTSTAMAEPVKSASDYKDLTTIDTGLKSKIETLLGSGIFEGVSQETFGISQNMTRAQFAKVASLVFGLRVDPSVTTSGFTDVRADDPANGWAIPYIEAAKQAGLIDGITDSTFAPGDFVTIGQLDKVFVKGLGKAVNTSASPWYADAVKQALDLNIHPANKSGDAVATRADLVTGAYGSWQAAHSGKTNEQISVASAQASGDRAVQIKLDKAVDTAKAVLTLSQKDTVVATVTEWSADKNSALLSLGAEAKLTNGSYTVTLSGLDASLIKTATGTFTIGNTATNGDIRFSIAQSYELSNVIDSGITAAATGTNGYATKAAAENPAVSKLAKQIEIKATNSSGEEIAVPGMVKTITSSNPSVVRAAVSSDNKGYILGDKAGSATVNIVYSTLSGDLKQLSVPVTVKSEAVSASLLEARNALFTHNVTVTGGVYSGQFNAYEKMDLKLTDNYGNKYEQNEIQSYNFAFGMIFFPQDVKGDSNQGAVGTVTVDTDGTVHMNGNVASFTLTAMTPDGKRASADVRVVRN